MPFHGKARKHCVCGHIRQPTSYVIAASLLGQQACSQACWGSSKSAVRRANGAALIHHIEGLKVRHQSKSGTTSRSKRSEILEKPDFNDKVFNKLTLGYADKADNVRVFAKKKIDKGKVQGMRNTRKICEKYMTALDIPIKSKTPMVT